MALSVWPCACVGVVMETECLRRVKKSLFPPPLLLITLIIVQYRFLLTLIQTWRNKKFRSLHRVSPQSNAPSLSVLQTSRCIGLLLAFVKLLQSQRNYGICMHEPLYWKKGMTVYARSHSHTVQINMHIITLEFSLIFYLTNNFFPFK